MAEGRFVPVYYEDLETNFPEVWRDARSFWTWARMAAQADRLWPDRPEVPAWPTKTVLKRLVELGLVVLVDGGRYTVRGLDKKRQEELERRTLASDSARNAAASRWSRSRSADRSAERPKRHATNDARHTDIQTPNSVVASDEAPTESGVFGSADEDPPRVDPEVLKLQKLAESLTSRPYAMANVYSGLGLKAVEEQLAPHGYARVEAAWRRVTSQIVDGKRPTMRQLVFGADAILNPVPNPQKLTESDRSAEAQASFDRRVERTRRELAALRGDE